MRNTFLALFLFMVAACGGKKKEGPADTATTSTTTTTTVTGSSLEQRLGEYMKLNETLNFDKLMDYIYPQVFTIAPRESFLNTMKNAFQSDAMKISIDNMETEKIHPAFEMEGGQYSRIVYSMDFTMTVNSRSAEETWTETMIRNMEQAYGKENVNLDEASGALRIHQKAEMVAIKDKHSPDWSFVSLKADDPIVQQLFSKELLDKLATYQ